MMLNYTNRFVYKTTRSIAIYVATTGSDTTGDGTTSKPFATPVKALSVLPEIIDADCTILIGAGTYDRFDIEKKSVNGSTLTIVGDETELVAESTATGGTNNTITLTGAGWTPNDYQDKFVEITEGTGYSSDELDSNIFPIISNDADTLTIPRLQTALDNTTKFRIIDLTTIIDADGDADLPAIGINSENNLNVIIKKVKANNGFSGINTNRVARAYIQGCDLSLVGTSVAGLYTNGKSNVSIDGCLLSSDFDYGQVVADGISTVLARYNHIKDNSVGRGLYALTNSVILTRGNYIENCSVGVFSRNGSYVEMNLATGYDTIDNCTTALYASNRSAIDASEVRGTGNTNIARVAKDGNIYYNSTYITGTNITSNDIDGRIYTYDGSDVTIYTKNYNMDNDDNLVVTGAVYQDGIFADIFVADGSTAQTIPTGITYTKLTCFTTNGESSNCTPDQANDKITITKPGRYKVSINIVGQVDTANIELDSAVFLGGVLQHNIKCYNEVVAADKNCSSAASGIIDVPDVGGTDGDIDVRIRHDDGGNVDVTIVNATLDVVYLGRT